MKLKNLLKRSWTAHRFITGALVLLLLFGFLPACAPKEGVPTPEEVGGYENYVTSLPEGSFPVPQECFEQAMEEGELYIYDWAEWWPEEIYERFRQQFGIKITRDTFTTGETMVSRFKINPKLPYDFAVSGCTHNLQLREAGALSKLNHDWLPNVKEYYPEWANDLVSSPNSEWGYLIDTCVTGYVWNEKYVDDPRIPSWSVLFEPDEKYRGKIGMFDHMWQAIGCALIYLGYPYTSTDEGELMEAKELLLKQKPYVAVYQTWATPLWLSEELWIAQQYSGDTWFWHTQLESTRAAIPSEGSFMDGDIMVIPSGVVHPAAAHLWLNYLYRPEISALLETTIGYYPTNAEAYELLPEELKQWPGMAIPDEYWASCEQTTREILTGKGLELRTQIWEEVRG